MPNVPCVGGSDPYPAVCAQLLNPGEPTVLIVMSGLAGSGKSAIADAIGRARGCPVLSVDPIEAAIVRSGVPRSFETGLAAYVVAEAIADAHLAQGLDVVIDAANYAEPGRAIWRALAVKHGLSPRIIECIVSDAGLHADRVASRQRGLAIAEPSWTDVEYQRAEWRPWPEAHLTLDTVDAVELNVARALAYLNGP
jgi:predicted kinase